MEPTTVVAGIDPGTNGAAAVIDTLTRRTVHTYSWDAKHPLDVHQLSLWLQGYDVEEVAIEKAQSMPGQGVSSTFKYGVSYGKLLGMLELMGVGVVEISPQKWKRHHDLIGADKAASRDKACELFPGCREQFDRVKDTHRAEASLIANWLRTT